MNKRFKHHDGCVIDEQGFKFGPATATRKLNELYEENKILKEGVAEIYDFYDFPNDVYNHCERLLKKVNSSEHTMESENE